MVVVISLALESPRAVGSYDMYVCVFLVALASCAPLQSPRKGLSDQLSAGELRVEETHCLLVRPLTGSHEMPSKHSPVSCSSQASVKIRAI